MREATIGTTDEEGGEVGMNEIKTCKELYKYCKDYKAEDWPIRILPRNRVDKATGVWIVTERKEILIVIPEHGT